MMEAIHPVTIKIAESTYQAAKEMAESRGYLSVEEYLSELLESETTLTIRMTPQLADALEEGLADSRADDVISFDQHMLNHEQRRSAWIREHQT
jgi:hypothetical protein